MKTINGISPKKKIDVINFLGKVIGEKVLSFRKDSMKKLPANINIVSETSPVYLPDSGTLSMIYLDEQTGKVLDTVFGGTYDSCINFSKEQFSQGKRPEIGQIWVQIDTYWNGRNMSWNVTIIKNQ